MKSLKYLLVVSLGFFIVFAVNFRYAPSKDILFTVAKGQSISGVAQYLKDKKVIASKTWFKVLSLTFYRKQPLRAGTYVFTKKDNLFDVMQKLFKGRVTCYLLKVAEGKNAYDLRVQLQNYLGHSDIVTFKEVPKVLLAETYCVPYGLCKAQLIKTLTKQSDEGVEQILSKNRASQTLSKWQKKGVMTVASIIEKETALKREKPLIAAVYFNRWLLKIGFQADPTVIYAHSLALRKPFTKRLQSAHMKINSLYNTYRYRGLPPGPIAYPSRDSLIAALNPCPHSEKLLYFVATANQSHLFSAHLREHYKNRRLAAQSFKLKRFNERV